MFDKLKKMKPSNMPQTETDAKSSVLQDIRDTAARSMGDKLKGLKKVSVMSDSSKGLEKGMDKAKEMLEDPKEEATESPSMEASEDATEITPEEAALSPEEIDLKIQELQKLKNSKLVSK